MELLSHILRLCVVMLFAAFGANTALTMPLVASDITYFQTETTHLTQGADVGFAARAPPLAVANVAVTGGVTVMQGSTFSVHGQATVASLFGFIGDLNVPNSVRPPITNPTAQQLASARDLGVDPRWVRTDGGIDWLPNSGFANAPQTVTLQPGARIDRYGNNNGGFLSPAGTPFDQRA